MKEGHVDPSLQDTYTKYVEHKWTLADLERYCTYLGNDFRYKGSYQKDYELNDWPNRNCKSHDCPERKHCIFHSNTDPIYAEEFNMLFNHTIKKCCFGGEQFLGRTVTISFYFPAFYALQIKTDHPLSKLLHHLGCRGRVVGYLWGEAYEGVNGWLTPNEAKEFSQGLPTLPLPQYPATYDAIEKFRPVKPGPYEAEGVPFEELSLSFVRTIATIAAQDNKGIAWANY